MKAMDIVKLIDPETVIGVVEPGFRGTMYFGEALSAAGRADLMERQVKEITLELVEGVRRICICI